MSYVLDTSAWSDALRGGRTGRKLASTAVSRVLLAAPVLYELRRVAVPDSQLNSLLPSHTTIPALSSGVPLKLVVHVASTGDRRHQARARGRAL